MWQERMGGEDKERPREEARCSAAFVPSYIRTPRPRHPASLLLHPVHNRRRLGLVEPASKHNGYPEKPSTLSGIQVLRYSGGRHKEAGPRHNTAPSTVPPSLDLSFNTLSRRCCFTYGHVL